jgi:TolB protein
MDIAGQQLRAVTRDFYINTEPSWSPDGRMIIFTSNRGGNPQIYQVSASGNGSPQRVSFNGDYNARAAFTPDGNHIAMMHRVNGIYRIGILDLDSGTMRVLGSSPGDSSSPSVAPNGSMVLHDTVYRGRSVLAMVSSDGRIQLVLPARNGSAQDPAWSPFLH